MRIRESSARRRSLAEAIPVLARATAGLMCHALIGFGRPAAMERRTGRVYRR